MSDKYVKGTEKALSKMDLMHDLVRDKCVKTALVNGAAKLQEAVKSRVPVDTGNLKKKISVKLLDTPVNGTEVKVLVGADIEGLRGVIKDGNGKRKKVDRPAYYVVMLVQGYFAGKRKSRSKGDSQHDGHKFIAGQDFLTPALKSVEEPVIEEFMNAWAGKASEILEVK